jgi:hypothetical protein
MWEQECDVAHIIFSCCAIRSGQWALTRRVAASFGTGFAPSELVNSASQISAKHLYRVVRFLGQ